MGYHSYREIKETHELIFSCYHGQWYFSWAHTHDGGNGGVAQHGGHTLNNRLIETCCPGLPCTFLIYDIMLWSIDTCQIKLSADQYHVTVSRAQVYSSSRSRVLFKMTADQALVFDWFEGSCQVNLLKTEPVAWKPVNSNPSLKVNQIITVSSLQMLCLQLLFCDY